MQDAKSQRKGYANTDSKSNNDTMASNTHINYILPNPNE